MFHSQKQWQEEAAGGGGGGGLKKTKDQATCYFCYGDEDKQRHSMGRYLRRPFDVVLKSKDGHPMTKTSLCSCSAVSEQHMCTAHKGRKYVLNVNSVVYGTGQGGFDSDSVVKDTNVQNRTLYSAALTAQVYKKGREYYDLDSVVNDTNVQ